MCVTLREVHFIVAIAMTRKMKLQLVKEKKKYRGRSES